MANGHPPTSDPALPGSDTPHADPGISSSPGGPDPAPLPTPRVGQWLRERRETRGLDLARVERDTKISRRYLEAIELDQLELLPAPVYARGFVRGYARYLGLDEDEALARVPPDPPRPRGLEPLPSLRRREARWPSPPSSAAGSCSWPPSAPSPSPRSCSASPASTAAPATLPPATGPTTPPPRPPALPPRPPSPRATPAAPPTSTASSAPRPRRCSPSSASPFLIIEVATPDSPPGRVFAQAPDPGTAVDPGDDVTLIISSGPASTSSE